MLAVIDRVTYCHVVRERLTKNQNETWITKSQISAARVKRTLPALARRLNLDLGKLTVLAENALFRCAVCVGAMPSPKLYRVEGIPRGLICGRCEAALEKTQGNLFKLQKHRRFNIDYALNHGHLIRLLDLARCPGPFDEGFTIDTSPPPAPPSWLQARFDDSTVLPVPRKLIPKVRR